MPHNLSVVLITPEIPTNTGSIGRLCLATNSTLHLVDPLGFEINDARVKRAGLDYWKHLQVVRHKNVDIFLKSRSLPTAKKGPQPAAAGFGPGSDFFS